MRSTSLNPLGLFAVVPLALAGCSLEGVFIEDPQPAGAFTVNDLQTFATRRDTACFEEDPDDTTISVRGFKEYRGQYVLERNPTNGIVEMGQVDLTLNYGVNRALGDKRTADFMSLEISNVTGFLEGTDVTLGFSTSSTLEFGGVVWEPSPLETTNNPTTMNFNAEVRRATITGDGGTGGSTTFEFVLAGDVKQESATSIGPLSLCGTKIEMNSLTNGLLRGTFYLEEV